MSGGRLTATCLLPIVLPVACPKQGDIISAENSGVTVSPQRLLSSLDGIPVIYINRYTIGLKPASSLRPL